MTAGDMAALHALCFTHPRPWSAAEFADLLRAPHVWSVELGQGFALCRAIAGEAELLTLAVHPAARRQGLGRQLLSRYESDAVLRGAQKSFLEVAADNQAARALYSRAGYAEAGIRRNYYGAKIDAIVMRKPLI
ncbi:ribosomal protein S18-alanine N-acetyltransferase [Halodurantibacterium flavum]|uniref:[Ribosomal protein bS18]-alanine N-acetyltransferase n=1 Tax=Halodurantibacterium flavum TaxID=1382802 RepID=A0ABW4SA58_9RHOB